MSGVGGCRLESECERLSVRDKEGWNDEQWEARDGRGTMVLLVRMRYTPFFLIPY